MSKQHWSQVVRDYHPGAPHQFKPIIDRSWTQSGARIRRHPLLSRDDWSLAVGDRTRKDWYCNGSVNAVFSPCVSSKGHLWQVYYIFGFLKARPKRTLLGIWSPVLWYCWIEICEVWWAWFLSRGKWANSRGHARSPCKCGVNTSFCWRWPCR